MDILPDSLLQENRCLAKTQRFSQIAKLMEKLIFGVIRPVGGCGWLQKDKGRGRALLAGRCPKPARSRREWRVIWDIM